MEKLTQSELKEIAFKILEANETCSLSGSLALNMQGINTRREPSDIDIYLPFGVKFIPIEGMSIISNNDNEEGDYDEEDYERKSYRMYGKNDNTKLIDVFTPVNKHIKDPNSTEMSKEDYLILLPEEIIKFKIRHSMGRHWTRRKHITDIQHMLLMMD